ncbi:hypothetical protein GCM10011533_28330 [Streptosporangium jomthongense]|uniref:DUF2057 family protein n=1 Tax=Marinobacter aromaticivorans TaxID=1494078 RepID=A0ABW2IXC0_9GAMM|nr:DUF2057 family protein [Marinobacter aromaticivorans]GGE74208.1 hypothetical protein GCM10011533_28330 [Streptosporangium jomthongense]
MNNCTILNTARFDVSDSRRSFRTIRVFLAAAAMLILAGCSSALTRLETWEGTPARAADAATLKAPGAIQVSQVNGRKMTNYLMDDLALDYALLPGENEVVFTYKTIWAKSGVVRNGESKVHVIESDPQVVRFEASPNETYRFEFEKPESRRQAEQMLPEFSAAIVAADGQALARSTKWSASEKRTEGLSLTERQAPDDAVSIDQDGSSLERLKAVWATATEEEKKAFLRWAFE